LQHKTEVILGGMLGSIKFSQTKQPRAGSSNTKYAMWDLEDTSGMVRCILWPEDFAQHGHLVERDAVLIVRGSIDRRPGSEEVNLIVNELIPIAELGSRFTRGLKLRIDEQKHSERTLDELYEILRGYPGDSQLQLAVYLADGNRAHLNCDKMGIEVTAEMRNRVVELLGRENVQVLVSRPTPAKPPRGNGAPQRALARR
jgi:DNA polymerase-3 subunit alpha